MTTTSGGFYRFDALSLSLEKEYSLVTLRRSCKLGKNSIDELRVSKQEELLDDCFDSAVGRSFVCVSCNA